MPDLSRRSFFRSMVAAGVAATIDPDELLWTPGKKKIFISPAVVAPPAPLVRMVWQGGAGGWMHLSARTVATKIEFDELRVLAQGRLSDGFPSSTHVAPISPSPPVRSISSWSKP